MKTHVSKGMVSTVGIVLVVAVLGVRVGTQAGPEAEFKKLADAFSQAWAKADAKGIAALHTKDAIRLAGNGSPAVVGSAAIEKAFADTLGGPAKGTTLTITPNQYKQVTADVYVGDGTYAISGGTPPPGTPLTGQYMNTIVRQGGRWLIASSAVMPVTSPK